MLKPIEKLQKENDPINPLAYNIPIGLIFHKINELIEVVNEQSEIIQEQKELIFNILGDQKKFNNAIMQNFRELIKKITGKDYDL